MTDWPSQETLGELIGSRICHDLINPLGAIGNGLELLDMGPGDHGEEKALIADSLGVAQSRLQFLRIAFGAASGQEEISQRDIRKALEGISYGRLDVIWQAENPLPRAEVRLAFLLLLCLQHAMPRGGEIRVLPGEKWLLSGQSSSIRIDNDLWAHLEGLRQGRAPSPAEVQFALVPRAVHALARPVDVSFGDDQIELRF
ncbi:MAG: histidine phosphotransferase [Rhodobacteraceae bacterium]|nr:histidine phosphotransferase [Paracoccaceae bacterium]